jgi:DNA primase
VRAPRRARGLERVAGQPLVLVVEGVMDYLVGLSWSLPVLGLGGLGLRPDELSFLRQAREIVLLLDADRAGQAEAARLAAVIGPRARVVHPPPPAKDLADLACLSDGHAGLRAMLARVVDTCSDLLEDTHATPV